MAYLAALDEHHATVIGRYFPLPEHSAFGRVAASVGLCKTRMLPRTEGPDGCQWSRSRASAYDVKLIESWLDAIDALLEQHSGQLRAGIDDWSELLPAEVQTLAISRTLRELDEERRAEQVRHERELQELQDAAEAREQEVERHRRRSSELEAKAEQLRAELDTVQSRSRPYIDPSQGLLTARLEPPPITQGGQIRFTDDGTIEIVDPSQPGDA